MAKEWQGNMLLQVHDELLFEIPPEQLAASQSKIKDLIENALPLRIPVVVDLEIGQELVGDDARRKSLMAFEDLHRPLTQRRLSRRDSLDHHLFPALC